MICHIRIFYCKQQKCTLVNLSKRELNRIFSYEVGELGLETGRKQSSLEELEARTTGGGSLKGPSGQDTAGGISKNIPTTSFVFGHLQKFYFHIVKYEQMEIKRSPERVQLWYRVSVLLGNWLPGKHLTYSKDLSYWRDCHGSFW